MANPIDIVDRRIRSRRPGCVYRYEDIKRIMEVLENLIDTWDFNPYNGHPSDCDCEDCMFVDDAEYDKIALMRSVDKLEEGCQ